MNRGLAKHRGRSTCWPERLKERVSHKWPLHFKGTLTVLPTSERVCRGLRCVFCNISQSVASKKMNHGFSGSSVVLHQQCAVPVCQEASQAKKVPNHSKNRAQVKGQGLQNEGTNHQVLHHLHMECSASREHEEALFFTLFMEFIRQLLRILSCFRAKHVSKISISFVLTQQIDWNFQSIKCKTVSY